jgi:hypothetical protein
MSMEQTMTGREAVAVTARFKSSRIPAGALYLPRTEWSPCDFLKDVASRGTHRPHNSRSNNFRRIGIGCGV